MHEPDLAWKGTVKLATAGPSSGRRNPIGEEPVDAVGQLTGELVGQIGPIQTPDPRLAEWCVHPSSRALRRPDS